MTDLFEQLERALRASGLSEDWQVLYEMNTPGVASGPMDRCSACGSARPVFEFLLGDGRKEWEEWGPAERWIVELCRSCLTRLDRGEAIARAHAGVVQAIGESLSRRSGGPVVVRSHDSEEP